jgi:hypothetical protein
MPTEAATDADIVHQMLAAGMNRMRINCAHDTASQWSAVRENLRLAERKTRPRGNAGAWASRSPTVHDVRVQRPTAVANIGKSTR